MHTVVVSECLNVSSNASHFLKHLPDLKVPTDKLE